MNAVQTLQSLAQASRAVEQAARSARKAQSVADAAQEALQQAQEALRQAQEALEASRQGLQALAACETMREASERLDVLQVRSESQTQARLFDAAPTLPEDSSAR